MDGGCFTFELALPESFKNDEHSPRGKLVSMITISRMIYVYFHPQNTEHASMNETNTNHRASIHFHSFKYYAMVSNVMLVELDQHESGMENGFLMTIWDSSRSQKHEEKEYGLLLLKPCPGKASSKKIWFQWIRYLQHMDGPLSTFISISIPLDDGSKNTVDMRSSAGVRIPDMKLLFDMKNQFNEYPRSLLPISKILIERRKVMRGCSNPIILNTRDIRSREFVKDIALHHIWIAEQERLLCDGMDRWSELLFKCEELQKLLESRKEILLEESNRKKLLQERHAELLKRFTEVKEYNGLVDRSDSGVRAEWRQHFQLTHTMQSTLHKAILHIEALKTKRQALLNSLLEVRRTGQGMFMSIILNWIWTVILLVAFWLIFQTILGMFSWASP
jgi:hypothetical protein